VTEWIEYSQKEPTITGEYLVLINRNVKIMEWGFGFIDPKRGVIRSLHGWNNSKFDAEITHWMPLPKLPEAND
jgi:hypothetical protein